MSEQIIEQTIEPTIEQAIEQPPKQPVKRGRKPKYATDEERKAAKRIQNKAYRERKKQELIMLRKLASGTYQQQIQQLKTEPKLVDVQHETEELIKQMDASSSEDCL